MDDKVSDDASKWGRVLDVLESARDPVLTSAEIADRLGVQTLEARELLNEMQANGMVENKRGVWWPVPAPYFEMEAVALIQPLNPEKPVSITHIKKEVCEQ